MAEQAEPVRVLVVDDEPYITEMLAMSLRYVGYVVDTALNGNDALRVANSSPPISSFWT